jgi:hypothetical protein
LLREHFEQSGLTRAIYPSDSNAVTWTNVPCEVLEKEALTNRDVNVIELVNRFT